MKWWVRVPENGLTSHAKDVYLCDEARGEECSICSLHTREMMTVRQDVLRVFQVCPSRCDCCLAPLLHCHLPDILFDLIQAKDASEAMSGNSNFFAYFFMCLCMCVSCC
jgi:hypothetical protein